MGKNILESMLKKSQPDLNFSFPSISAVTVKMMIKAFNNLTLNLSDMFNTDLN